MGLLRGRLDADSHRGEQQGRAHEERPGSLAPVRRPPRRRERPDRRAGEDREPPTAACEPGANAAERERDRGQPSREPARQRGAQQPAAEAGRLHHGPSNTSRQFS